MRSVLNVSLPTVMAEKVRKEVRRGNYASVSEFFRSLIREWEEDRLLTELRESQHEVSRGKAKALRSLRDLR